MATFLRDDAGMLNGGLTEHLRDSRAERLMVRRAQIERIIGRAVRVS
jgi:hypothetical protein